MITLYIDFFLEKNSPELPGAGLFQASFGLGTTCCTPSLGEARSLKSTLFGQLSFLEVTRSDLSEQCFTNYSCSLGSRNCPPFLSFPHCQVWIENGGGGS